MFVTPIHLGSKRKVFVLNFFQEIIFKKFLRRKNETGFFKYLEIAKFNVPFIMQACYAVVISLLEK